jgi:hypothetical protein
VTETETAKSTIHDAHERRTVLIAVCVALMAVIASVTGLNVAQPDLAVEFDGVRATMAAGISLGGTGDARPSTLVYLYVEDVDAVADKLGVTKIHDMPSGREFEIADPDGNRLRIGTVDVRPG